MSRRITSRNNNQNAPQSTKTMTLRDLQDLRVRVPPAVAAAGLTVMLRVMNDGRVEVGLVKDKIPTLISLQEANKLALAKNIIAGAETVSTKQETVERIKTLAATALIQDSRQPEPKVSAQAETLRLKGVVEKLESNLRYLKQAVTITELTQLAVDQITTSITTIRSYLVECQFTRVSDDKLADLLLKRGVIKYLFDKFSTTEIKDLHTVPVENYLFPRKMSRGLYLSYKEVNELSYLDKFMNNQVVSAWFTFAKNILDKSEVPVNENNWNEKIFIPPSNFSTRVFAFDDLPREVSTMSKPTMMSVMFINAMFGNFRPSEINEDSLNNHLSSFLVTHNLGTSGKVIHLPVNSLVVQDKKPNLKDQENSNSSATVVSTEDTEPSILRVPFKVDTINPLPIKEQYFAFLEQRKFFDSRGLYFTSKMMAEPYKSSLIFNVAKPNVNYKLEEQVYQNFYAPKELSEEKMLKLDAVKQKMPAVSYSKPREYEFNRVSPLTKDGLVFIKSMRDAKVSESLIDTYQSFLSSFLLPELSDAALRIMKANLRTSFDTFQEEEKDEEEDDLTTEFGKW